MLFERGVKMIKKLFGIIFIICVFVFGISTRVQASTTAIAPHWQQSPITVYIPQDEKAQTMKRAFIKWQNLSGGKLKFKYVDEGPADIDVAFIDKVDGSDGPIGSYSLQIQGQKITKADIRLATKSPTIKKYSKNLIYTTMLHEVGHALGMADTNRKRSGFMFMPVSEEQDITKLDIRKLYMLNGWSFMDRRINN